MLLTVVIGLLEVAATDDSGCMPFSDEAATYKYVAKGPKNIEIPAQIDNSGMYPDYTHVKRFCKGLHGEDTTGWFVGICLASQWYYYEGVQECDDRRCSPLPTNDTVSFEYLKATVNPGIIFNITVHPDASGKYPELTYIKRICKNFPTDSNVQGHIIGMCYNAEWQFSSTPTCPASGCPPLPDDGIVFYEYYGYAGDRHTVGPVVTKDSSGNYPSPTHARRRCRALSQEADPGEFVAICYKSGTTGESHWEYYKNIGKCPDPRCKPLEANESVHYEYFTMTNETDKKKGPPAKVGKSGKYPEHTCVKKVCSKWPYTCSAGGPIFGECIGATWNFTALMECINARGCDENDLFELGFKEIMVREGEFSDSYRDAYVLFYATGSKVSAQCRGETARLECSNGEWHDLGAKTVHRAQRKDFAHHEEYFLILE
uniref:Transforming growth factor beta mimic 3 n=1 Tax=Heligmosomoides polygyrus bakeri TaxID=375939 RepID=A0A2P1IQ78_HELBE|nr:transforming growth factor beta mimic 3 [Heligmosomoides bakeri]